jgi:hypothetical protein
MLNPFKIVVLFCAFFSVASCYPNPGRVTGATAGVADPGRYLYYLKKLPLLLTVRNLTVGIARRSDGTYFLLSTGVGIPIRTCEFARDISIQVNH